MSTTVQETASTEVRCWGAELVWNQAEAEMFRKICRDAFGRDCFCAEGGKCWLTEAALDGLKSRLDGDRISAASTTVRTIFIGSST